MKVRPNGEQSHHLEQFYPLTYNYTYLSAQMRVTKLNSIVDNFCEEIYFVGDFAMKCTTKMCKNSYSTYEIKSFLHYYFLQSNNHPNACVHV